MELFFKTAGGVLVSLILILTVGRQEKDMAMVVTMVVCCGIYIVALRFLEPVILFLRQLEELSGLHDGMLGILLKIMGIGLVGELAGLLCQDGGVGALGKGIQFLAGVVILSQSLPIFETLLDLIQGILGEL